MAIIADPDSWSQTALDLETAERDLRTTFTPVFNEQSLVALSRNPVDGSLYSGGADRAKQIAGLFGAIQRKRGYETGELRRTAADYRRTEQAAIDAATGITHDLGLRIE